MKKKLFYILFCFSILVTAQITNEGNPVSWNLNLKSNLTAIKMPAFDVDQMLIEDALNDKKGDVPWRFGKEFIVNYTLDQLEPQLDPQSFLRVSRNCIAQLKAIENIARHFNSRLKLSFSPICPHEVLVSRVRVPDFLKWIDGSIE